MYIGNDSRRITLLAQASHDVFEIFTLLATLSRQANDRSASIGNTFYLLDTACGIGRRGIGHRLYLNRVRRAYFDSAHIYFVRHTTRIGFQIHNFQFQCLTVQIQQIEAYNLCKYTNYTQNFTTLRPKYLLLSRSIYKKGVPLSQNMLTNTNI